MLADGLANQAFYGAERKTYSRSNQLPSICKHNYFLIKKIGGESKDTEQAIQAISVGVQR